MTFLLANVTNHDDVMLQRTCNYDGPVGVDTVVVAREDNVAGVVAFVLHFEVLDL